MSTVGSTMITGTARMNAKVTIGPDACTIDSMPNGPPAVDTNVRKIMPITPRERFEVPVCTASSALARGSCAALLRCEPLPELVREPIKRRRSSA
jgi:hypothetical protein